MCACEHSAALKQDNRPLEGLRPTHGIFLAVVDLQIVAALSKCVTLPAESTLGAPPDTESAAFLASDVAAVP
jgi:hypothetical protein